MFKFLLSVLLLGSIYNTASAAGKQLDLEEFEREMRITASQVSARLNLKSCLPDVSEDFYTWGCEYAIKKAIRANIELEEIVLTSIFNVMISDLEYFDESNVDEEALVRDVKGLLANIGSISEENIDEIAKDLNEATIQLGQKHYRYN